MRYLSVRLIKSSPFIKEMIKLDDTAFINLRKENRKSQQVKFALQCTEVDKEKLKNDQKQRYLKSVAEKVLSLIYDISNYPCFTQVFPI